MDFRDMLTEIKDVVTNHSGSNYVLSNIYLGGNLDNRRICRTTFGTLLLQKSLAAIRILMYGPRLWNDR